MLEYIVLGIFFLVMIRWLLQKSFHVHKSGIILITGAGTGIGRHAAEYLAKYNHNFIILAGIRFPSEEKDIKSIGKKNLIPIYLDVCKHDACVDALKRIEILTKSMNVPFICLINNAGYLKSMPIEFHNLQEARNMFETNFFAAMNLIQLFLPLLRQSKGRIINISSFTALAGPPLAGVYAATKGAIESFSDSLRREVAHFGISVSLIEPCYVATNLLSAATADTQTALKSTDSSTSDDSSEHRKLYAPFYSETIESIIKFCVKCASNPQVTTSAIEHALTSKLPATRYPVANNGGVPASILSWLVWFFPDRVADLFSIPIHT